MIINIQILFDIVYILIYAEMIHALFDIFSISRIFIECNHLKICFKTKHKLEKYMNIYLELYLFS